MRKIVAAVVLLLTITTSSSAQSMWSPWLNVISVDVQNVGMYLYFSGDTGCGASRAMIRATTGGYKEMVAVSLSALTSSRPVRVLILECLGEDSPFMRIQVGVN